MSDDAPYPLIPCPFGCPCFFANEHDLKLHLRFFSYADKLLTHEDHLDLWNHAHALLNRSYGSE
jgi:hypothetical protein